MFIAAERNWAANRLAFVLGVLAFSTVLSIVIIQLAVNAAFGEISPRKRHPRYFGYIPFLLLKITVISL